MSNIDNNPQGLITAREATKQALDSQSSQPQDPETKNKLISRRYQELESIRQPYLERARLMASIVMPYLYPEASGSVDPLGGPPPNQSLVSKGVINLARSLGQTIFPANGRFFEYRALPSVIEMATTAKKEAEAAGDQEAMTEAVTAETEMTNQLLGRMNKMRQAIKSSPDAENFYQCLLHAIVAGQGLFLKPNLTDSKVYPMDRFVSVFDSSGETVEIIARDSVHISKFAPEHLRTLFGHDDLAEFERAKKTTVEVFTRQVRRFDHWEIQVEIAGKRFAPMEGKEKLNQAPFILVPFFVFPGTQQPISWCEHLSGDITMYENLSLTVSHITEVASKCLTVLPPSARTTQAEMRKADGGVIFGDPKQVELVTAQIAQNLTAVQGIRDALKRDLMGSFLLNESIQREGERVTKYELQQLVQGLRNLLGGLFLSIGRRWQYPYLGRVEGLMIDAQELQQLPDGLTQVVLTAGVETLDAADDLDSLDQWAARGMQIGEPFLQKLNTEEYMTRVANLKSIDQEGLLFDDNELANRQGLGEIMGMIAQLGPNGPQIVTQAIHQVMSRMSQPSGGETPAQPSPTPPLDSQSET